MQLSDTLAVTPAGILIYKADRGIIYEVIGGHKGQLNLRELK